MTTLANDVQVELAAALGDDPANDTSMIIVSAVAPLRNPPVPIVESVLTLVDTLGSPAKVEIVRYTTVTDNGDGTLTIGGLTRGQEGTTAQSFDIGAIAYQAVTAGVLAALTTPEMLPAVNAPQSGWLLGFGSATEFQWVDPATIGGAGITVDSVSPAFGSVDGGTNIVLTGTGFDVSASVSVTVDGNDGTGATVDSETQISATTPPGTAGLVDIVATQGTKSDTLAGAFEYVLNASASASGGTETTATIGGVDYKIHTFTADGTITIDSAGSLEYLIVGGGGAGGADNTGAGGGAGEFVEGSTTVNTGSFAVTVGAGGAGTSTLGRGAAGSDSSVFSITALGGGGGGGAPVSNDFDGTPKEYAAGGGGGINGGTPGSGGGSVGGDGGGPSGATSGTANTGSGGGGVGFSNGATGGGGSGIVIIRYRI